MAIWSMSTPRLSGSAFDAAATGGWTNGLRRLASEDGYAFAVSLAAVGVAFVVLGGALWPLAARLDLSPMQARAEKPEFLLSLPLAPIGLLPLAAGDRLGDGALVLATGALLALLFVVREAANLATARAEVEEQRDKLARANALQDDMIHLITHELRNPLTLVMSYAQMTRRAAQEEQYDSIPTYLGHVERAGKTIQRLVENLLH